MSTHRLLSGRSVPRPSLPAEDSPADHCICHHRNPPIQPLRHPETSTHLAGTLTGAIFRRTSPPSAMSPAAMIGHRCQGSRPVPPPRRLPTRYPLDISPREDSGCPRVRRAIVRVAFCFTFHAPNCSMPSLCPDSAGQSSFLAVTVMRIAGNQSMGSLATRIIVSSHWGLALRCDYVEARHACSRLRHSFPLADSPTCRSTGVSPISTVRAMLQ